MSVTRGSNKDQISQRHLDFAKRYADAVAGLARPGQSDADWRLLLRESVLLAVLDGALAELESRES